MCAPQLAAARTLLGIAGLALASAAALAPGSARASMMDQIILNKCSSAMQEDFQKAGKTPPEGMIPDTCNCVVAQVKSRQSIDQAKTFCTQQSFQKYGHP